MAIATLQEALTNIATRLNGVGFLAVSDQPVDSITPPHAIVQPGPGDFIAYDASMASDSIVYRIYVTLWASASDIKAAQNTLYPFLVPTGSTSVRAAVVGATGTPAGVNVAVEKATALRPVMLGEPAVRYLVCDVVLRVTCS